MMTTPGRTANRRRKTHASTEGDMFLSGDTTPFVPRSEDGAAGPSSSGNDLHPISTAWPQTQRDQALQTYKASACAEPPATTMLDSLGIKMRDFAYESKLPPIPPVIPRQVQPSLLSEAAKLLRLGQRLHTEEVGEDVDEPYIRRTFYTDSDAWPTKSKHAYEILQPEPLEREDTEPIMTPTTYREIGLPFPQQNDPSASHPSTPPRPPSLSLHIPSSRNPVDPIFFVPFSQPSVPGHSQNSDEWIDTPLVTPNGSMQIPLPDNSAVPASQLDAQSHMPGPEIMTYSQLGVFPSQLPASQSQGPDHLVPQVAQWPENSRPETSQWPDLSRPVTPILPANAQAEASRSSGNLQEEASYCSDSFQQETSQPPVNFQSRTPLAPSSSLAGNSPSSSPMSGGVAAAVPASPSRPRRGGSNSSDGQQAPRYHMRSRSRPKPPSRSAQATTRARGECIVSSPSRRRGAGKPSSTASNGKGKERSSPPPPKKARLRN